MSDKIFDRTNESEKLLAEIVTPEYPENPYELLGMMDFKERTTFAEEQNGTAVQEFYRNATVLVTGGTGFLGIVLIEKLLRSCPHLRRIYVLVRSNNGKSFQERFDQALQKPVSTFILERVTYKIFSPQA